MRRILFDGTFYQGETQYHGGGEYGKAIFEELLKRKDINNYCGIFFLRAIPINANILKIAQKANITIHIINDLRNVPRIIDKYSYEVVYSAIPYRNWNEIEMKNIHFICSFHGVRQLEYVGYEKSENHFWRNSIDNDNYSHSYLYQHTDKDFYESVSNLYKNTLNACKNMTVITGSEHTKYSIMNYYPELQDLDIRVLDDPMKKQNLIISNEEEKMILTRIGALTHKYSLIISAGIWFKNGLRGILAYDYVYDNNYKFIPDDYKTVVLGVKDKKSIQSRLKHPERFIFEDYVSDIDLEVLYKNAHLLLFLSLTEGYGYPALEAMNYETLCLCSTNTSIPEVCGEMVLYANPFLIDEIANRILQSFSEEIRNKKMEIIRKKYLEIKQRQDNALNQIVDIICGD